MLKIENVEVVGWEHAIRGMRNPKNSWERSDTVFVPDTPRLDYHGNVVETIPAHYKDIYKPVEQSDSFICEFGKSPDEIDEECNKKCAYHGECDISDNEPHFVLGTYDHSLMMSLAKGGPVHAKYRRMITVYLDITAPLYWWKEFDTYKVGTVANSCSTMHKIHDKEFTLDDFSCEHLIDPFEGLDEDAACEKCREVTDNIKPEDILPGSNTIFTSDENGILAICSRWLWDGPDPQSTIKSVYGPKAILESFIIPALNANREAYLKTKTKPMKEEAKRAKLMKKYWWQMIQLLPSSYNQKRTVMLNYEVLTGIYPMRKDHKLDEWHVFCDWIKSLPYSEIITGEELK